MRILPRNKRRLQSWRRHFEPGHELRAQLTATAYKVMGWLAFKESCFRRDRPGVKVWIEQTQGEIADKADVSREHACRTINDMHAWGLIEIRDPGPDRGGRFQGLRYQLTRLARWLMRLTTTTPPRMKVRPCDVSITRHMDVPSSGEGFAHALGTGPAGTA